MNSNSHLIPPYLSHSKRQIAVLLDKKGFIIDYNTLFKAHFLNSKAPSEELPFKAFLLPDQIEAYEKILEESDPTAEQKSHFLKGINTGLSLNPNIEWEFSHYDEHYFIGLAHVGISPFMEGEQSMSPEANLFFLSLIAQRTSNAVLVTNAARKIIWVNPGFTKITGYTFEEVVGKNPGHVLQFEKSDPKTIERVRKSLDAEEPIKFEILNRGKFGREYWLEIEIKPLKDDAGHLLGFMAVELDITDRKKIAQALTESEERYRSVVSAISEGLVVQDINDKIIMFNQSACNILALSPDQLVGKDSYDPLWEARKEDGSPFNAEDHPTMITLRTGKNVDNMLMDLNTGKGERKIITISSRPVLDHQGVMYGAVASFRDITQVKKAEKQLIELNQLLMNKQEQLEKNIQDLHLSREQIAEQKEQLEQEVLQRMKAEKAIMAQHRILKDIIWHQNHGLRRPVATIMGIANLLEKTNLEDKGECESLFAYLNISIKEVDDMVRDTIHKIEATGIKLENELHKLPNHPSN